MDNQQSSLLLSLPPELVLLVLTQPFLPFSAVASFRRTCRLSAQLVCNSSNVIHRALCFAQGLADASSTASAGLVVARSSPATAFDPDELDRVKREQKCFRRHYDGVTTWEEFARARLELARNWRDGTATKRCVRLELDVLPLGRLAERGIWRFKLDYSTQDQSTIVTSGVAGGMQVFDPDGKFLWSTSLPRSAWPHVELSNGFLFMVDTSLATLVWQRNDLDYPVPLLSASESLLLQSTTFPPISPMQATSYHPFCRLAMPSPCSASKARYPLFVAVSRTRAEVYLFDVPTGTLSATVAIDRVLRRDPVVLYVELDSSHIFISGNQRVHIITHSGALVGEFPPASTWIPGLFDPMWTAVHHDTRGGHLVAISVLGWLLWSPNHREVLSNSSLDLAQHTVVLRFDNVPIEQLAVENERAVFITERVHRERRSYSLWLLNLHPFSSISDFQTNIPSPICIDANLPAPRCPSRVEMASDAILVPGQACLVSQSERRTERSSYKQGFGWWTLDNVELSSTAGVEGDDGEEWNWPGFVFAEGERDREDALLEYSFGSGK